MRLTISEQSDLPIREVDSASPPAVSLRNAYALIELSERARTRMVTWSGRRGLRVENFVGTVRIGDLQVEILPKLDGCGKTHAIRQNLLRMIAAARNLELRPSGDVLFHDDEEPFIVALARLYCRQLIDAVRGGLRQDYVDCGEVLPRVRGKIHWPSQVLIEATRRPAFSCTFDERSEDTALNRTLKAALVRAERLLEGSRGTAVATELRHAFSAVSDQAPSPEIMRRLETNRASRRWKPLLTLAKLILGDSSPDLGRDASGTNDTFALLWDMNVLFEEYVGVVARSALRPLGVELELQGGAFLGREIGQGGLAFLMRPDVIGRRRGVPELVADTKWKRLAPGDTSLGVANSDVYQLLAYSQRYGASCAALVYPHQAALGSPGVQREYRLIGQSMADVRIRLVTVDLANLESVPGDLVRGLLFDGAEVA